ncbi:MAG TPA: cytosine permease [Actinomycetota bacterium]
MSSPRTGDGATVTRRIERVLEEEAPVWGIEPVPPRHRLLSGLDFVVLWGDLAIGLLVLLTGALLVPSIGFPQALLAIVVGSVIGSIPLALVGMAGAREGVPGMVLFRPVLGVRGSYVPSVLNVVQLVGWTGFEFWVMALVANEMSRRLFHFSSYWLWLGVVAVICTALALGGPILLVRRWLEKFGAWVVAGVAAWITIKVLTTADLAALWNRGGAGGYPGTFWLAVDLVIAMPVSWLPLVADYNRFGKRGGSSAAGTFAGYAIGNAWFYAVGALLVLAAGLTDVTPAGLGRAVAALAGGWIVLLALLVGETDEAFADIYSAAVSSQNVRSKLPQRGAILAVAIAGVALAAFLGHEPTLAVGNYEYFLLLLGSVFVPLFGVFVADYFVLNRKAEARVLSEDDRHDNDSTSSGGGSSALSAVAAWVVGFLIYQWSVPTPLAGWQHSVETVFHGWLHLPFPLANSAAGASIPSFAVALLLHLALSWRRRSRDESASLPSGAA